MPQIRTLKDLDSGNKLEDTSANQYPLAEQSLKKNFLVQKKTMKLLYIGKASLRIAMMS